MPFLVWVVRDGQVNTDVASNASVALLSVGAVTAAFIVGPIYDLLGCQICLLLGGWTYALYAGSLLAYNHHHNGGFVIAAGAILGLGAAFLWIPQGVIMTTYVPEAQKGRAIAVFWIIFNLGGSVGSFASLGLNFHSSKGTVSDSTYIAYIVIMLFGWVVGSLLLVTEKQLNGKYTGARTSTIKEKYAGMSLSRTLATFKFAFSVLTQWRMLCLIPMFFYANVFYTYQQNAVNAETFNIRTRSLNSALYWLAQMFGGLFMGAVLDFGRLTRKQRGCVAWTILFVTGFCIWGGGYAFQLWSNKRIAAGHKQDVDMRDRIYIGPMFLYIFYGMYDALWQGFCYWMIGANSNNPAVNAIMVGAYKTSQSCGGAMAWRLSSTHVPAMNQMAMNWGLTIGTLLIAVPSVLTISLTSQDPGNTIEGKDEEAAPEFVTADEKVELK
ncbi:unnamed protein product [Kuraishia capsulata CBS 1993]|uniref:Major facilitator superfamily (MFS) profile domain-containing protein n=1 Tax=Kuraishia capsulata CBS 1993 TaxID=1382522 RepID=W6MGV0_9ASCO|nr:uncharacterized protein KUCA_T00001068001 [Kuraishia capsulata CBS 1993]CDK25101.1 unnamed protein product [Kuraishia capsulata CBS 1993]